MWKDTSTLLRTCVHLSIGILHKNSFKVVNMRNNTPYVHVYVREVWSVSSPSKLCTFLSQILISVSKKLHHPFWFKSGIWASLLCAFNSRWFILGQQVANSSSISEENLLLLPHDKKRADIQHNYCFDFLYILKSAFSFPTFLLIFGLNLI